MISKKHFDAEWKNQADWYYSDVAFTIKSGGDLKIKAVKNPGGNPRSAK